MLIALYFWFQATFGGPAALQDRIESHVEDPARLAAALVVVEEVEALEQRLAEQTQRTSEALRKLHVRHQVSRADYLEVLRPLRVTRRVVSAGLLEARAELRKTLTRSEWAKVFSRED